MQLYKVEYHAQEGGVVRTGTILVCSSDAESAEKTVVFHTGLTSPRCFVTRVKPSIYELKRAEFTPVKTAKNAPSEGEEALASLHELSATAKIFAYTEATAIHRFGDAIKEQASATKSALPRHVEELLVNVDRQDFRPAPSRVDEQAIYKEKRIFSGGSTRPR